MDPVISEFLGGEAVLGPAVLSNLDLARATREGLPSGAAIALAGFLGSVAGNAAFAASAGVAATIGARGRTAGKRLTPVESDLIVRTATALAHATGVLGDRQKAAHWLNSPNRALGGAIPITLLDTSAGEHEVQDLLDRIEYGVYS